MLQVLPPIHVPVSLAFTAAAAAGSRRYTLCMAVQLYALPADPQALFRHASGRIGCCNAVFDHWSLAVLIWLPGPLAARLFLGC